MMRSAIFFGMTIPDFYNLTVEEFTIFIDVMAEKEAKKNEFLQNLATLTGWLSAAMARQKRLPKLKKILQKSEKQDPHKIEKMKEEANSVMATVDLNEVFGKKGK